MSRRSARPADPARWVFNRLAGDYRARPAWPEALVARLLAIAGGPGARVAELGAGTGLLALPLARAGATVHAVEPARAMLDVLEEDAGDDPRVRPVHAAGEESGLPAAAFDLVVVGDALQWIDPERGGREIRRLLAPSGVLAVVTPRLAETPFLAALAARISAANFKARPSPPPVALVFSIAGLAPPVAEAFEHEETLSPERLDAVLRSLSYVGPALGPDALAALLADARSLAERLGGAVWRRAIRLEWSARAE